MQPVIISQSEYEAGIYPRDIPIMVAIGVGMSGKGGMDMGKTTPTKITIKVKSA